MGQGAVELSHGSVGIYAASMAECGWVGDSEDNSDAGLESGAKRRERAPPRVTRG